MILTIDLDIIMEPCINLYNKDIQPQQTREQMWNNIQNWRDIERHLSINKDLWNTIVKIIEKASIKQIPYIAYSDNHGQILPFLNYIYNHYGYKLGTDLIINIDHHHDLGYHDVNQQINHNIITCANWAYFLLNTHYTNAYLWLHNQNSEICNHFSEFNSSENIFTSDIDIDILLEKCDGIIFIGSSAWIPLQYNHYLFSLQALLCKYFPNILFFGDESIINPNKLLLFKPYAKQ